MISEGCYTVKKNVQSLLEGGIIAWNGSVLKSSITTQKSLIITPLEETRYYLQIPNIMMAIY